MKEIHAIEIGLCNRKSDGTYSKFGQDPHYSANAADVNFLIEQVQNSYYKFKNLIIKGFGDPLLCPLVFEHIKTLKNSGFFSYIYFVTDFSVSKLNTAQKVIIGENVNTYIHNGGILFGSEGYQENIFCAGIDYMKSKLRYGSYPLINMNFVYSNNSINIESGVEFSTRRLTLSFLE